MIAHLLPLFLCLLSARAPAQDSPEALIQKGRALLEQGDAQAALPLFEEAAGKDGDKLRSRVWVLRAWIALGRTEDALSATDELKAKGAQGPELDYLYGMGFYDLALRAVQAGQTGAFTGQTFGDAVTFLERALSADAARFGDAWVPLAEAAWYVPDLEKARAAADKAVAAAPKSVRALIVRGRVCMSQYVAEKDDPAQAALAESAWKAAVESYERAAAELATRTDPNGRADLADARLQLGNALMWKSDKEKAAAAYTAAIAASPGTIDYLQVQRALGSAPFLAALDTAAKSLPAGASAAERGALAWWRGFAGYDLKQYAQAEADFREAIAKEPGFVNSWYYVFKCAYNQQQYEEAMDALKQFRAADAAGLVAALDGERELNLATLEFLIGWCADGEKHDGRALNLEAAALCEILTELDPKEPRHWNNLGLFVRDHGEALERARPDTDPVELAKYWERAMVAYETALAMSPEDPNYLNDTALLLHYHLKRDLARARAMYQKAYVNAEAQLQRKDLDPDARARLAIAKRDSKNNLELLEKELGKGSGG